MQSYNTVMAMSFLQSYADAIIIFNNQEMLDQASKAVKGEGGSSLADANHVIARHLLGALWPLSPLPPETTLDPSLLSASSRIRDIVCTAASDPCCKIIEARTAYLPTNSATGLSTRPVWSMSEACKSLNRLWSKFDILDQNRSIVTSGSLVTARGLDDLPPAGKGREKGGDDASRFRAAISNALSRGKRSFIGHPLDSVALRWDASSSITSISEVACRSSAVSLVEHSVERAHVAWTAGAYIHWYERYGCGKDAVKEAIEVVGDMVSCYRSWDPRS